VALLSLTHGHTRAVPESLFRLERLVVVVSARAQRRTEFVLMFCESLYDNRGNTFVHAEVRS